MPYLKIFILTLLSLLFIPHRSVYAADDISGEIKKKELEIQREKKRQVNIKKKEKKIRHKIKTLKKKQGSIINMIVRYRKNYRKTRKKLASTVKEIDLLEKDIRSESESLVRVTSELNKQRILLKKRVLALYKLGRTGMLESLIGFTDLNDISHRLTYMRYVSRYNAKLITRARTLRREKKRIINVYNDKLEKLKDISERQKKEIDEMEHKKLELNILYREVKKDKHLMEKRAKEIAGAVKSLNRKLNKLFKIKKELTTEQKRRKLALIKQRGYLPWPVDHILTVTKSDIGNGIVIKAPENSKIKTVAKGRVELVTFYKGFGNTVIIDHAGGNFSVYAHLSEIRVKKGDEIASRDIIGVIGSSGWEPDNYLLYLEIRINGKNVNPLKWLKKIK